MAGTSGSRLPPPTLDDGFAEGVQGVSPETRERDQRV